MQQGRLRASVEWTRPLGYEVAVKELVRTNDVVLVSFVRALLDDAQIPYVVLDNHMSIVEGSLGVLPRRIMVGDDRIAAATRVLAANGLAHEVRDPNG